MNKLYSSDKTQRIDQLAASYLGVNSFELMQLAAAAVYQHVQTYARVLVITGPGNNGGDGFVVAELARQQGQSVQVLALRAVAELHGDARSAAALYQGEIFTVQDLEKVKLLEYDVVVDAMFGTGLKQVVRQPYAEVINWLNQQPTPVIAVDVPSGLNASTGQIEGVAVSAQQTIAILARNTGLYTADGKDCCGVVEFESLGVPEECYQSVAVDAQLISAAVLQALPLSRSHNSHKGRFGHVVAVGGQTGMLGAVLLASKAVLKSGAGSVTAVTDARHVDAVPLYAAEIMSSGFAEQSEASDIAYGLAGLLDKKPADVLLLGMGLGQTTWAEQLFKACLTVNVPLVVDADGLNLLSVTGAVPKDLAVITPHPKEAATLLHISVSQVQANRWLAAQQLAQKYHCVVVLKGAGTLVADAEQTWCCPYGSANLATAGSGDVLAGMVAGLMAQGFAALQAAQMAVVWHALVGEHNRFGLSMTATDLLNTLHEVWTCEASMAIGAKSEEYR